MEKKNKKDLKLKTSLYAGLISGVLGFPIGFIGPAATMFFVTLFSYMLYEGYIKDMLKMKKVPLSLGIAFTSVIPVLLLASFVPWIAFFLAGPAGLITSFMAITISAIIVALVNALIIWLAHYAAEKW